LITKEKMASNLGNQLMEGTTDEVDNFLEPPSTWVGYHPMGGSNYPGTTNVPHRNVIRDNGKAANTQIMYFNPNTLSLDYSRGKEGTEVSERSIISWKQIHLPGLKGVALTERDHVEYALFAKMVREEVRESATAIIEAKYMDLRLDMLGGVKNVPKSSDFRKLRSSLNARATELLVQEEVIVTAINEKGGSLAESNDYLENQREQKLLYSYKFKLQAEDLANEFMEKNNIVMRKPLNQKKRHTNFITVIFGIKLTALRKNSLMPMYLKHSPDKDNLARPSQGKKQESANIGVVQVHLSRTKSIIPAVKREAIVEKSNEISDEMLSHFKEIKSTEADRAVSDTVGKILRRGEEYFGELNRSCFGSEPKINKEQFMKLVSCEDSEFTSLLINVREKSSAENSPIPIPRNPYLEKRAENIKRHQERLLALQLVDKEEADDAIKDAWEFSGVLDDSSEWCDFDRMLFSTSTSNCAGLTDNSKEFGKQSIARKDNPPTSSTRRIRNKRKDAKEGKISLCVLVYRI
jgi:hypothetical protein